MRAVGVAEVVGCRRGNDRNVDVNLAILHRLPASTVRAQHSHAPHVPVRAVVAERSIHAAFDVMHHAGLHQVDDRLVTGKRGAGKPHEVFGPHPGGGLQRSERDAVSIAQMMMAADGHAIASPQSRSAVSKSGTRLSPLAG